MKYPEYEVIDMIACSGSALGGGRHVFALSYRGNCEDCPWRPSGYCPCIQTTWSGENIKYQGNDIPLIIIEPGENSPEDCWKEEAK